MKTISLIIPLHNEEKNIALIHGAITNFWRKDLKDYLYEIIFINDGSTDRSAAEIDALVRTDKHVKHIEFSRNFGKEAATSAGLHEATGDAAIMLDADLQHPVELMKRFTELWEEGNDVVIGVRTKNEKEGIIKKSGSYIFYKIMRVIGDTKIVPGETDYRLVDRRVLDAFKSLTERDRLTRGLLDWLGFKRTYVEFVSPPRAHGEASYSAAKLFKLAMSSFVTHSFFLLKLAGYIGAIITVLSGIAGIFIIVERYILNDPLQIGISGPAALATLNIFLAGIMLSGLGLVSLYIAVIDKEVLNRPLYVIRRK